MQFLTSFTNDFDDMIYKLEKICICCKIGTYVIGALAYADDVILLWPSRSGLQSKIGTYVIGALAYADDVILLCPSRSGLQKMINICEQFGIDFQVIFNGKKTQCLCFSKSNDTGYGPVTLNNEGLKWESKVNHLGNILNQRLNDDDLRKKKDHFIGSVNKMFSNFANVQSVVLTTLFKRYIVVFMVVRYGN